MILKKYEDLPEYMQNEEVKKYYEKLKDKTVSLCLKRVFDIIFSFLLLIILSPIFLVLALAIKIDSKGNVFFRQERVTRYGKKFRIFKFRTMIQDADKKGSLVTAKSDSRITRVGRGIRKIRLDEIPQLINVLKGEMSFVGTRPEVKKYVDCYTEEMNATLLLPAGITSMASVQYKNEDELLEKIVKQGKSMDDAYLKDILPRKMEYNLKYIQKFSIWEDIKICIKTMIKVL